MATLDGLTFLPPIFHCDLHLEAAYERTNVRGHKVTYHEIRPVRAGVHLIVSRRANLALPH